MRRILIGAGVLLGVFVLAVAGLALYVGNTITIEGPFTNALFGWGTDTPAEETLRKRVSLPDGFEIGIYAGGLGNARILRFTSAGDLLLSTPRSGQIKLLERDRDDDGRADGVRVLLDGLARPHGLALDDDWLYIAETDAVRRVRFDAESATVRGELEPLAELPGGGFHWTRTLAFGPDGVLYVSVGSSCNVCIEDDKRRAAVLRVASDGAADGVHASGLRNTVGFDWRPATGELYGVDNGADLLGDDFPPDELNRIVGGGFYGWPFRHGFNVSDPEYGDRGGARVERAVPPAYAFGAHVAPLAIHFLEGPHVPPGFEGAALVTQHGSWNRRELTGYRVVSLHWRDEDRIVEHIFLTGFEQDGEVTGRPVDVVQGPDGAIYVSDDYAGAVYRIHFDPAEVTGPGPRVDPPLAAEPHGEPVAGGKRR